MSKTRPHEGVNLLSVITGLTAGAVHVVSGPDHLAAVAPIAAHQPKLAMKLGLRWGVGHSSSVAVLGLLGLAAREYVDIDLLSEWSEFAVGFVLVGVGLWGFRQASRLVIAQDKKPDSAERHAHQGHTHTAFFVGALHGAAGTGHLLGVLPSLALPVGQASVYLAAYVVGAILAMTGFGYLMGRIAGWGSLNNLKRVLCSTSLCAVGVGLAWIGLPAH